MFNLSWTPAADPNQVILSGFRPHALPDAYEVEALVPGQLFPVSLDLVPPDQTTDSFSLADHGLSPGTYTIQVIARSLAWGNADPVSPTAVLGRVTTPAPAPVTAVPALFAPPSPANVVVPTVEYDGWNQSFENTVSWTEPASAPGVATPDEFLITMQDGTDPNAPLAIVDELPGTQRSYQYQVVFAHEYTVKVWALSQKAGASPVTTVVGEGPGI